jgi:hypothetical protein
MVGYQRKSDYCKSWHNSIFVSRVDVEPKSMPHFVESVSMTSISMYLHSFCYTDHVSSCEYFLTIFCAPIFIPTTRWQRCDGELTNGARKIDKSGRVIHGSVMLFVDMTLLLSCFCKFKPMLVIVGVLIWFTLLTCLYCFHQIGIPWKVLYQRSSDNWRN